MDRVDKILDQKFFWDCMDNIEKAEKDRRFCLHGIDHGLAVARICYIISLEEGLGFEKDVIYAMALLHDIGRACEYRDGVNHHKAGAELAESILKDADYNAEEIKLICEAIGVHKCAQEGNTKALSYLLFKADKLSRNCFACKAYDECYWQDELKNKHISF